MNNIVDLSEKIIVALDTSDRQKALDITKQISPIIKKVKVGMELFYSEGPNIISELHEFGVQVFVDLKIHDIPNTAAGAAMSLTKHGVWMWNVHVTGGITMMKRAKENAEKAAQLLGIQMPLIIGVTQLTSTSQQMLEQQIGIKESVKETVVRYAQMAKEAGLDGVVASAQEVPFIKAECGNAFITVTPGIRMQDSETDDQVRITTPRQAIELGTDYMVIGRNITMAANPYENAKQIVKSLI